MADINVHVEHGQDDIPKVQKGVAKVLDRMSEKMGFDVTWSGNDATLGGKALKKGTVSVNSTAIDVEINLALFAKPMKGMIETQIEKAFSRSFGS